MSDITATADFSAAEVPEASSEGLVSEADTSVETSTQDEGTYEAPEAEALTESEIEALFEVDGTGITLDEARNGYLRQADYTRKTQELAEMRQRLTQAEAITAALEKDPVATLQALQEAFGVQAQGQEASYEELDPETARIAALEAKLEAQEAAHRQAAIDAELAGLHEQFGEFDDAELFAHAIKGNHPSLEAAYKTFAFDSMQRELAELQAAKAANEARREAARAASATVHEGSARPTSAVSSEPTEYGGIREAFLAAKKSLGYGLT